MITASEFASRLGPTERGVRVLFIGLGDAIYELELPYINLPTFRAPIIPADWTRTPPPHGSTIGRMCNHVGLYGIPSSSSGGVTAPLQGNASWNAVMTAAAVLLPRSWRRCEPAYFTNEWMSCSRVVFAGGHDPIILCPFWSVQTERSCIPFM